MNDKKPKTKYKLKEYKLEIEYYCYICQNKIDSEVIDIRTVDQFLNKESEVRLYICRCGCIYFIEK